MNITVVSKDQEGEPPPHSVVPSGIQRTFRRRLSKSCYDGKLHSAICGRKRTDMLLGKNKIY